MAMFPFGFDPMPIHVYHRPRYSLIPRRVDPFREVQQLVGTLNDLSELFDTGDSTRNQYLTDMKYNENGDLSLRHHTGGFKPEEIKVELDGDKLVVIGDHSDSKDGESVERKFRRVIRLPKDLDHENIKCELDHNGELLVQVPRKAALNAPKQNIPINVKNAEAIENKQ